MSLSGLRLSIGYLHTRTIGEQALRGGINVLGRNSALRTLVVEMPPPVVAKFFGFTDACTQRHAQLAAQPWSRYAMR